MLGLLLLALLPQSRPDVAIIVLDDVAQADLTSTHTPELDSLASGATTFARAYAQPWCAPTRDSLMRSAWRPLYRGGLCEDPGTLPQPVTLWEPPYRTLPQPFAARGYATALVGKWHLGIAELCSDPVVAPLPFGFERWLQGPSSGGGCFGPQVADDGILKGTFGVQETIRQRDAFLAAITDARGASRPFFGVLSFTDAHKPFRVSALDPTPPPLPATDRQEFESEIRGLDTAIGQIVDALGPDAWVIVVGDNGTPDEVAPVPGKAKLTVFERGVNVPLIVAGPGLSCHTSTSPVHIVDLLPSLIAGLGWDEPFPMEGSSFVPALAGNPLARGWAYVENPTQGTHAVIEERWKLVQRADGTREMYDLVVDPGEVGALPPTGTDYERLASVLDDILGT